MRSFNDASLNREHAADESADPKATERIALLVALSCVLQVSESLLPHPIPGLRLGLANLVTLVALVRLGFRAAVEIALLRTVLSSLIMGTFLSPTFVLSICGGLFSALAMGLLLPFSRRRRRIGFSIIGISIAGALVHNVVQLYLAYLILVRHGGVFAFLPWLCYGAVGMGWITGAVAGGVCRRLESGSVRSPLSGEETESTSTQMGAFQPGDAFLHRIPAETKMAALLVLALTVLVWGSVQGLLFLALIPLFLALTPGASPDFLLRQVRRYKMLVLTALLLPLFFNDGTQILWRAGDFALTREGLDAGLMMGLRIVLLILLSALLTRTTSPEDLTRALSRLLLPLKCFGVSERRTAGILGASWTAFPLLWDSARNALVRSDLSRPRRFRELAPRLSDFIAGLYAETGSDGDAPFPVAARDADSPPANHGTSRTGTVRFSPYGKGGE